MKTATTIKAALLSIFATFSTAFASGGAGDAVDTTLTYNSGILVLLFAGFLALVVVVQAVPALLSLYGMIKGAAEAAKGSSHATATTEK